MEPYHIHVIHDDTSIREGVVTALEGAYLIEASPSAEEGLEAVEKLAPDLILLDVGLPGMDGVEALRRLRESHPEILFIMISAYEDIETVISCMKLGAHDYVVKPIHMDALEVAIRNALQTISLKKEVLSLQEHCLDQDFPFIMAESKQITHLMDLVKKVARSPDTPVMVHGETGTGKELIARAIHYHSPQSRGPLVAVNCAAIPSALIESELFGHEQGHHEDDRRRILQGGSVLQARRDQTGSPLPEQTFRGPQSHKAVPHAFEFPQIPHRKSSNYQQKRLRHRSGNATQPIRIMRN